MTQYETFIYLTICETSMKSFKASNFGTYQSYCNIMNIEIDNNKLSEKGKSDILEIYIVLGKIYGMEDKIIGKYISDYFKLKDIDRLVKCVTLSMDMFPLSYEKL